MMHAMMGIHVSAPRSCGSSRFPNFGEGTRPKSVPFAPPTKTDAPQGERAWAALESRVEELVDKIKPNQISDSRRCSISTYVKNLIKKCFVPEQQVEAYMFGSVPLKTYLPDGDIDLAVFQGKGPKLRDSWTTELSTLLEEEGRSSSSLFRIRDVHVINAEVKLLKCLVDNIVVDISFDTLGGLCTVAFLESIDRHIGKEHLFKRSIILVKAWCYYESRLLGAHHGLLSTYALETMVLYIFNMYHQELQSPLKVLRKFLEVFSKFDWDAHALSLQGPIPLSSFPEPKVEPVAGGEKGALLRGDVLRGMLNMYSPRPQQGQAKTFPVRAINIVDPLLSTNNLGRSVTRASKARLRKAFRHGSAVLDSIFAKTGPAAIEAVDNFFRNTWNAQCTQPLRFTSDALASVAIPLPQMPSLLRTLMVPGTMPQVLQHQHGFGETGLELGQFGRAYSGPLPERPRSSASNASASSDPVASHQGGESRGRGQSAVTGPQSGLSNGPGREQRRHEPVRASLLGLDPGGHHAYHKREGSHYQVGVDGSISNGLAGAHAASEPVLLPVYTYALPAMPHPMVMAAGSFPRYHLSAMQGYSAGVAIPNGRVYAIQQHPHPVSTGLVQLRTGVQHNGSPTAAKAEAGKMQEGDPFGQGNGCSSSASDLLEGDLKMLSQHLEVARHCHAYVSALDKEDGPTSSTEQHPRQQQQPPHQPFRLTAQQQSYLRSSRSQLFENARLQQQLQARRQAGASMGPAAPKGQNAGSAQRQRGPGRSNSFDDLHRFRAHAAASAAPKPPHAAGALNQHPSPPTAKPSAAPMAGVAMQAVQQASSCSAHQAASAGAGNPGVAGDGSNPSSLVQEGSALRSDAQQQTSTGQPRPPETVAGSVSPVASPSAPARSVPGHVRTVADAVREGPARPRTPQQYQDNGAITPPRNQPLAPYSGALLGLGRAPRSPVQNGLVAVLPQASSVTMSSHPAVAPPVTQQPPGAHGVQRGASAVTAGTASMHSRGRLRGEPPGADAAATRDRDAQESAHLSSPVAHTRQPQDPPPARFTLDNEGDFPQLGAVKTKRRSNAVKEPVSPPSSAAITPIAEDKPLSPSSSGPRGAWGTASVSMGNSPASGWPNRPDAKAAIMARPHMLDSASKSEGSSPMAASSRGGVWVVQQGQPPHAVWTGAPLKGALQATHGPPNKQ